MVSVFTTHAFAQNCQVKDSKISQTYAGACLNGLANGKGKANGDDEYEGDFKDGNKHGFGIYRAPNGYRYAGNWSNDNREGLGEEEWKGESRYVGEFSNNDKNGFGTLTTTRSAYPNRTINFRVVENGQWIGDSYVEKGMFEDGLLIFYCNTKISCKQMQAKHEAEVRRNAIAAEAQERRNALEREAQQRREAADRERDRATACNKYYNGYVGYVDYNNGKKSIWGQDIGNKYGQFVVLGSGGGNVSIKGTDNGSYPGYNNMDNVSCVWLREKER